MTFFSIRTLNPTPHLAQALRFGSTTPLTRETAGGIASTKLPYADMPPHILEEIRRGKETEAPGSRPSSEPSPLIKDIFFKPLSDRSNPLKSLFNR